MSTLQQVTGLPDVIPAGVVDVGPVILLSEWADDGYLSPFIGSSHLARTPCPCGHPTGDCTIHFPS